MQDPSSTVSYCPSFSTYSRDHNHSPLSKIAARVGEEEPADDSSRDQNDRTDQHDEFEFAFPLADPEASAPLAEASHPVFPLFDRSLSPDEAGADAAPASPSRFVSLGKFFVAEERGEEDPPSSSESEADEMDGVPRQSFCVWKPNSSPARCKKSNSTGSSSASSSSSSSKPKWRIRDLLRRSSSDGKDSYIFLAPPNPNKDLNSKKGKEDQTASLHKGKPSKEKVSAHEVFYVRRKAMREGDKRRSYLPYRQDLVGFPFFSAANGLGRTLPPI